MNDYKKSYFTNISEKDVNILKYYLTELEKSGVHLKDKKILDIGCATGNSVEILKKNNRIYGVDISNHAIDECKRRFPKIKDHFQCIDINLSIPKFKTKFDLILLLDVIEHLENFEFLRKIITSYLTKDGVLIITTPNANSLTRFAGSSEFTGEYDKTHRFLFTPYTLDFVLRKMGLGKILLTTPYAFMRKNKSIPKLFPFGGQILAIYKKIN